MTKMLEPMMSEFQQEAATTRRVLERVPADKLSWKPHPKSMSLGQLALHVASIPGNLCRLAQRDGLDTSEANFNPPGPTDAKEILATLDAGVKAAEEYVGSCQRVRSSGYVAHHIEGQGSVAMPRVVLLRTIMLNHWYHHRGQLSVYLRMLDVPVPSIYGPSADENPFN